MPLYEKERRDCREDQWMYEMEGKSSPLPDDECGDHCQRYNRQSMVKD